MKSKLHYSLTKILLLFTFCMFLQTAFAQVTISPWKMNKGGGIINYSLPNHGNPAAYSQMTIPSPSDPNWTAAPVDGLGRINFSTTSILGRCLQELDFTYFETSINIPSNFNITDLTISFAAADDGARAYIFNSSHPSGAFIGQISLGANPVSQNYASLAKAGEVNRLVIVQFDDCPTGNNLTGAQVKVNGAAVPVSAGGCTTSNFFWSNAPTISGKTATGTINGIGYTYTSTVNVRSTSNMFAHSIFPTSYNVPNANPTIQNIEPSSNTLTFASPMTNPVLVFSSIGGGPISVPINFSAPVDVLWSTSSGAGSSFVQNSPTQITGKEAYAIVRMNGTFSSISFDYLTYENYVNFAFGADFSTTVPDTVGPTVTLNGNATETINAGTTYTDLGATATDNCSSPTVIVGGSVDTNTPGVYTLTYDATDASGNAATQVTRTVTVADATPPTVITQNITVNLDASGNAIITPQQIDNGSSDTSGAVTLSLDQTNFTCADIATNPNTVTLTVTDTSGNTATGTATVTVVDTTSPTIVAPPDITNPTGLSNDFLIVAERGSGGRLSTVSPTGIRTQFATVPSADGIIFENDSTAIVSSFANNSSLYRVNFKANTTSAIVNLGGRVQGMIFDGFGKLYATNEGLKKIQKVDLSTNLVTDVVTGLNRPIDVMFENSNSMLISEFNLGTILRYDLTTHATSILASGFYQPTAIFNDSPTTIIVAEFGGNKITRVDLSTGNKTLVATIAGGPHGIVRDNVGNLYVDLYSAGKIAKVDINGTVTTFATGFSNPVFLSVNPVGGAFAAVSLGTPTASDNCTVAITNDAPAVFPIGTTTVTYTATDNSGNTASDTQNVTVIDAEPPSIGVLPNLIVNSDANACSASGVVINNPAAQDNSGSVSVTNDAPSVFPIGTTTVTYTATDNAGNVTTSSNIVTVVDNIAPTVVTQNITVQLDASGNASLVATDLDGGSTDNCGPVTLSLDAGQGNFTCANVGTTNIVTLVATDSHGNVAIGTATVTVQDVTPPTVVTKDITVQLDATGNASIVAADIDNGSNDSCGVASMTLDAGQGHFTCANVGQTNVVTLAVIDVNGNTGTGTAVVTVVDNIAPTVVTQNVTVNLDATGVASVTAQQFDGGSTDACGVASYALTIPRGVTIDPANLTCADVGTHNVTLVVTDVNGNAAQAPATVTVQDVTAPTVVTQNVTVQLDATGVASVTAQQFDNGSTDACGVASYALTIPRGVTIDPVNLTCADVGTHNVTLVVTDINGNAAQAPATVTVQDTTAPTMITQPVIVQLDANGAASITTAMVDNSSYDNCSVTLSLDITSFSCANVGINTVTLTGTDPSGNVSSATAQVTVQDNIAPTVTTQAVTVQLDANGAATITPQMIDNASSDNCSIASMTLDITSFSCENLGSNTVNLTVTDVNGNATTAPATVTVQDTTAPTMLTQDITVQLDATGAASITTAMIDNGSYDNCSVVLSLDIMSFGCENVGTNTVTLTGADPSGNTSTATATVTVVDAIAPTVITQAFSTTITGGVATVTAQDVDGGSYDNCGIQSMSVSPTTFVCGDQGNHTVTLTVTDNSGNVSTSDAIVTVLGDVPTIAIADFTAVPTQNTNTVYLGYGPQSMTLNTSTIGGSGFTYNWTSSTGEIVSSVANPTVTPLVSTTYTVTVTNATGCEATTSIDVCVIDARYINKEGEWDDGKVLVCHHEGHGNDKDDDDDEHQSHNGTHTIHISQHAVEKHLKNHGDTLGGCNATCSTTYVEVVADNDDDDHHGDDHANNDDDKDDNDHANNDDDKDDDKGHNGDNNDDNQSDSNKTKVVIYPNPVVKYATISLKTKKKKGEAYFKVFDYKGRKIFSKKSKDPKKGVRFNMSRYKEGTYFVRVKYKGKVYTATILKKR